MAVEEQFDGSVASGHMPVGPLGSELDGFGMWLAAQGFSEGTLRRRVSHLALFSQYLARIGVECLGDVEWSHTRRFLKEHLPRCRRRPRRAPPPDEVARGLRAFARYQSISAWDPPDTAPPPGYQALLEEYLGYLRDFRNLAPSTIKGRRRELIQFLTFLGPQATPEGLSRLYAKSVLDFFQQSTKNLGLSARRSLRATLRIFFRFCGMKGYLKPELAEVIPTIRTYKLDRVPRGISPEGLERLLTSIDRTTAIGRRDFAILQLLATYGVRDGQVRALRLADLDWAHDQLRFPALKRGKEVVEPLTPAVGNSLLDYLRHGRPSTQWPHVFLTARAPIRPLATLFDRVAKHLAAAGVQAPTTGTHTFRHAFATRRLRHGQSLKAIAESLGHRSMQSTAIYTKVDFNTLYSVALPWPEERS